jgi:hypothetical protein
MTTKQTEQTARTCRLCGKPTTGCRAASGQHVPFICQPCKDAEDAAALEKLLTRAIGGSYTPFEHRLAAKQIIRDMNVPPLHPPVLLGPGGEYQRPWPNEYTEAKYGERRSEAAS